MQFALPQFLGRGPLRFGPHIPQFDRALDALMDGDTWHCGHNFDCQTRTLSPPSSRTNVATPQSLWYWQRQLLRQPIHPKQVGNKLFEALLNRTVGVLSASEHPSYVRVIASPQDGQMTASPPGSSPQSSYTHEHHPSLASLPGNSSRSLSTDSNRTS